MSIAPSGPLQLANRLRGVTALRSMTHGLFGPHPQHPTLGVLSLARCRGGIRRLSAEVVRIILLST
jgi:hypothetical protein